MSNWRLFVAAMLPPNAAADLWAALGPLRRRHPHARWIAMENLHVTLVFIGSTNPAAVPEIAAGVRRTTAASGPLKVVTGAGGGRTDDRRGGVAWLRLDGPGVAGLRTLGRVLDAALTPTPGRGRLHSPHLTVARRATDELLRDLEVPPIAFTIERVALFRSHTGPAGASYEPLHVLRLIG